MPSSAYTLPLWYVGGTGVFTSPQPPAGTLWVVRNVSILIQANFPQSAGSITITRNDGAPICGWAQWELVAGQSYYYEGRQVILQTHWIVATLEAPGAQVSIAGYQLTAP